MTIPLQRQRSESVGRSIWRRLTYLGYRLRRRYGCQHPDDAVVADILDGDFHGGPGGEQGVEWCRRCGAYRRYSDPFGKRCRIGEWRIPSRWWDS